VKPKAEAPNAADVQYTRVTTNELVRPNKREGRANSESRIASVKSKPGDRPRKWVSPIAPEAEKAPEYRTDLDGAKYTDATKFALRHPDEAGSAVDCVSWRVCQIVSDIAKPPENPKTSVHAKLADLKTTDFGSGPVYEIRIDIAKSSDICGELVTIKKLVIWSEAESPKWPVSSGAVDRSNRSDGRIESDWSRPIDATKTVDGVAIGVTVLTGERDKVGAGECDKVGAGEIDKLGTGEGVGTGEADKVGTGD
jgi:hypothetical protein